MGNLTLLKSKKLYLKIVHIFYSFFTVAPSSLRHQKINNNNISEKGKENRSIQSNVNCLLTIYARKNKPRMLCSTLS